MALCSVQDCKARHYAKDVCSRHYAQLYMRLKRNNDVYLKYEKTKGKLCYCGDPVYAKRLCNKHYQAERMKKISKEKS